MIFRICLLKRGRKTRTELPPAFHPTREDDLMVQVRIMHTTDAARVAEVAEILLPWIAQCPDLVMGDPVELGTRGGTGSRIYVEVIPATRASGPTAIQACAERVDGDERFPARRRGGAGRRALPSAPRRNEER
ncbi:hypothetical protein [Streptosporangium sp. NPDC051022]|uniref:hypothetical protein n=1 Tax=Streptosporangium sp. NPDC051022 TaxID=3155752 RepID=UPI00344A00BB